MIGLGVSARLALLLAALAALAGTHWRAYTLGATHERNAAQATQTQALRESAAAAIRQADHTIEATHERAQTERRIAADRLRTAGELERLRGQLAAATAAPATAPGPHACPGHAPAIEQLLAAMAADIAKLAEHGAAIAAAADGHAADALMLAQACQSPPAPPGPAD